MGKKNSESFTSFNLLKHLTPASLYINNTRCSDTLVLTPFSSPAQTDPLLNLLHQYNHQHRQDRHLFHLVIYFHLQLQNFLFFFFLNQHLLQKHYTFRSPKSCTGFFPSSADHNYPTISCSINTPLYSSIKIAHYCRLNFCTESFYLAASETQTPLTSTLAVTPSESRNLSLTNSPRR